MVTRSDRIRRDLEAINACTATPGEGITRLTFSPEYMQARQYVEEELRKIGARVATTIGGNLCGRFPGRDPKRPSVMMGSHIDSVAHGGRFDGVAGVVAAFEAGRGLVETGAAFQSPIDVVVFAEEEGSRFGSVMIGSRAWVGQLRGEDLERVCDGGGTNYAAAMKQAGLVPDDDAILTASVVSAMIELHIEQSLLLESKGIRIGVVEGINGIRQFTVTLEGVPNHAGATPMHLRRDAMQAAARIIAAVETIAREAGERVVATVGSVKCKPNQANVIPGVVEFTVDIRDMAAAMISRVAQRIQDEIARVADERALVWRITPRSDTSAVSMSPRVMAVIEEEARARGVLTLRMPSGALHDSSILPAVTDVGMIFIPSHDGRSHCPEEESSLEDLQLGTELLLGSILRLAA